MKKRAVLVVCAIVMTLLRQQAGQGNEYVWDCIAGAISQVTSLECIDDEAQTIFFCAGKRIYKIIQQDEEVRGEVSSLRFRGKVHFLYADPEEKNGLYAASSAGLYVSLDRGEHWQRIFRGKNSQENECTSVVVNAGKLFLGTTQGVFLSNDKGRSWQKAQGMAGNSYIYALSSGNNNDASVLATSSRGVLRTLDAGRSWERVFVVYSPEDGRQGEYEEGSPEDKEDFVRRVYSIAVDPQRASTVYVGTSSGVYKSQDSGASWQAINSVGLIGKEAFSLSVNRNSVVYAATASGIFFLDNERWHEITLSLGAGRINAFAFDSQDTLYAACEKGLWKARAAGVTQGYHAQSQVAFVGGEPGITVVQQAAIAYAEVAPKKIQEWRRKAARKALLPELSLGARSSSTDLWHWEGGSTTKSEDDELRKGKKSVDWDIGLRWNLGELIWNEDQTSIDVRSRLMVELRNDILDEVNKLYFERLRLKGEIDELSIEDRKKKAEKELRISELTASLDALTGGYFSSARAQP